MTCDTSVVICAYTLRRWPNIVAAVRSTQRQTMPPREILLIVDHNPRLAERARAGLPEIRVLENTHSRGLSGARNTAVDVAAGDVLAFLDDDAAAEPDWLERMTAAFVDPDVIATGGVARPVWPKTGRPAMFPGGRELDWVVGCSYRGQPERAAEIRNVMGCAMAFRREVFERIGGFAEQVGRTESAPLGCEETELCIRARQHFRTASIVFEPRAVVHHQVGAERLTWRYLVRRCWAEGVSKAVISRMVGASDALATERRYLIRVLPAAMLREFGRALCGHRGTFAAAIAVPVAVSCTVVGYLWAAYAHR